MSQSFDRHELSQLRTMLSGVLERLDKLERHVGLTHDREPATADAPPSVSETGIPPVISPLAASQPDKVSEAEIISAELREVATAPDGESPILTGAPAHVAASSGSGLPLNERSGTPAKPRLAGESLESLIGGRVLTWVGGILLVLAAAFFVVWSWRHLEVRPWARVMFIHAVGLGAIIAGSWFRGRNYQIQARVMYGVGIFALYASAFAMTHLYQLGGEMRELFGFIDGALITALAIVLALRNQSVGIILLGALGGYLTPLLTIHSSGDQMVVFTYLALLNVALVVSAQFGKWEFLKPLAFFVTAFILFFSLAANYFSSADEATAMLTLHALIFLVITTIPQLAGRGESTTANNIVLILNSLGFLAGYAIISELSMPQLILPAWILAVIHGLITWQAFVQLPTSDRLARVNLGLTCLFVTLGLTYAFHESQEFWTTIWAIEGFAFGLIGFSFRDRQMLVTSAIAFGLALLRAAAFHGDFQPVEVLTMPDPRTVRWGFYALLIGLAGSSYWWIPKLGMETEPTENAPDKMSIRTIANAFLAAANLVFLAAMFFQCQENLHAFLLIGATDAAVLWAIAFARNIRELRCYTATLAICVAILAGALLAEEYENFLQNWNYWCRLSFVASGVLLTGAGLAYWLTRSRISGEIEQSVHGPFTIAGHLILLAVLTAEIFVYYGPGYAMTTTEMATLSVAWGVYAALLVASGFLLRYPLARYLGIFLFGIVLLKVFLVDLAQYELIIRVIALLILGLLLLGVSLLYQKFKSRIGLEL